MWNDGGGGRRAIRGFAIQTLIALLEALEEEKKWTSVALEPNVESEKVDILWQYPDGTKKAQQVKSSQNPFSKADVHRWAAELESWREADNYELVLVGTPGGPSVATVRESGRVAVPPPKNLDLQAFQEQAAHRLSRFLESQKLRTGNSVFREILVEWLVGKLVCYSTSGRDLAHSDLAQLLAGWVGSPESPKIPDTRPYLCALRDMTGYIDIRGLQVGKGRAHRFPIEELYISLTARRHSDGGGSNSVLLEDAIHNDRLVVVGDPGAGKTTFLRRIAHRFSLFELDEAPEESIHRPINDRTFPIFVRLNDLALHMVRHATDATAPPGDAAPAWLLHFLTAASEASCWGLDEQFFRVQLQDGLCTVLLDGLDEAADRIVRQRLSRLIEQLCRAYKGCRFVVTCRPAAYTGDVTLPDDFVHATIDPLSDEAVEVFLSCWCQALHAESRSAADNLRRDLISALRARPEIRRMARNAVMLTALAVVHWNERRLPEQRAELYESIIRWLARSREQRTGREREERSVVLLQELALHMQNHPEGMKIRVPKRWAAEQLAREWGSTVDRDLIAKAQNFLGAEELDSGIIVERGNDVQFWHRTFQEFLAARAIGSRPDSEQYALLLEPVNRLYLPEWREVMVLLAGVLCRQGPAKMDNLVRTVLSRLGGKGTLAECARCAGLLGAMLRDLVPLDYQPPDGQYHDLLVRVMAIFLPEGAAGVSIENRIAAADALGQAGDPRIDFAAADYWITIPEGTFLMGAQSKDPQMANYDAEAREREAPVHEVYLEAYRVGRYPVTVGQYRQFMEDDGYQEGRWWKHGGYREFSEPQDWEQQQPYPSRPVVGVSWWEAVAYCVWTGFRLPTEAEWERVARCTDGRKYPWGNADPDSTTTNCRESGIGHPTPVGLFPTDVTAEGVFDLGGNVWDWCQDWYDDKYYARSPRRNPVGPDNALYRVIRGGSWRDDAGYCRAAIRFGNGPQRRYDDVGFRVAAAAPSENCPAESGE